jgi:hypothetical protein
MKYSVEMGSVAMIYIPNFIKIGSGIQGVYRYRETQIQWRSHKPAVGKKAKKSLMRSPWCLCLHLPQRCQATATNTHNNQGTVGLLCFCAIRVISETEYVVKGKRASSFEKFLFFWLKDEWSVNLTTQFHITHKMSRTFNLLV